MPKSALSLLTIAVQFGCLALFMIYGPLLARQPLPLLLQVLAAGLGLWAIITMRIGNFNITPDIKNTSRLVTGGPYKYIRHPMYSALLLATGASVLNNPIAINLGIWLILLTDLIIKLNYEEKLLLKHFPDYSNYRQNTRRLLPFLY